MGWTCFRPHSRNTLEIIKGECTWNSVAEDARPRLVDAELRSGVVFMAVNFPEAYYGLTDTKLPDADPVPGGGYTFMLVYLVEWHGGELCYKPMDEGMGPFHSAAPSKKLLAQLSPIHDTERNKWSVDWRRRVGAKIVTPSLI